MKFNVGQVVEKFIHHPEGVQFDMDDSGATMIVFFNRPDQNEIAQFKAGKDFEIRFTELSNVIMITTKIGNLNWMDAPYNVHLSRNLEKYTLPNEEFGLALTLMLVDADSGEIKTMRLMGLSTNFTRKFFGAAMDQKITVFDKDEYQRRVQNIYAKYDTNKIVKMSNAYCKIRG